MQIVKPHRIRHQYTQTLLASPERVFPLLCPVLEKEWAPGWAPSLVISDSGVMEKHCLFITPEEENGRQAIWINSQHDSRALALELWKVVPDHTVCHFDIRLAAKPGVGTAASIDYTCTSLGLSGDTFLESFTTEWYVTFMQHWEQALNYYLENGSMMQAQQPV